MNSLTSVTNLYIQFKSTAVLVTLYQTRVYKLWHNNKISYLSLKSIHSHFIYSNSYVSQNGFYMDNRHHPLLRHAVK